MSLSSFNEKIRQKPKRARGQWAFWMAFLLTGMLGLAWLAYIPGKLERIAAKAEETEEPAGNVSRVFESLRASLGDIFRKTKEDLASTSAQFASSTPAAGSAASSTYKDPNTIDFATFFETATSQENDFEYEEEDPMGEEYYWDEDTGNEAEEVTPQPEPQPAGPRRVLIGTSSKASSTPAGGG